MRQDRQSAEEYRQNAGRKRSKYRNVRTNGYASAKEARRAGELKLMEKQGEIENLREQVEFSLSVNGIHVCLYRSDFVYEQDGRRVVEDVKGMRTDVYRLKKRLMLACHNIVIMEV